MFSHPLLRCLEIPAVVGPNLPRYTLWDDVQVYEHGWIGIKGPCMFHRALYWALEFWQYIGDQEFLITLRQRNSKCILPKHGCDTTWIIERDEHGKPAGRSGELIEEAANAKQQKPKRKPGRKSATSVDDTDKGADLRGRLASASIEDEMHCWIVHNAGTAHESVWRQDGDELSGELVPPSALDEAGIPRPNGIPRFTGSSKTAAAEDHDVPTEAELIRAKIDEVYPPPGSNPPAPDPIDSIQRGNTSSRLGGDESSTGTPAKATRVSSAQTGVKVVDKGLPDSSVAEKSDNDVSDSCQVEKANESTKSSKTVGNESAEGSAGDRPVSKGVIMPGKNKSPIPVHLLPINIYGNVIRAGDRPISPARIAKITAARDRKRAESATTTQPDKTQASEPSSNVPSDQVSLGVPPRFQARLITQAGAKGSESKSLVERGGHILVNARTCLAVRY